MRYLCLSFFVIVFASSCKFIGTTSSTSAMAEFGENWYSQTDNEIYREKRFIHFYLHHHDDLRQDIAKEGGTYLNSLSEIVALDADKLFKKDIDRRELLDLKADNASARQLLTVLRSANSAAN